MLVSGKNFMLSYKYIVLVYCSSLSHRNMSALYFLFYGWESKLSFSMVLDWQSVSKRLYRSTVFTWYHRPHVNHMWDRMEYQIYKDFVLSFAIEIAYFMQLRLEDAEQIYNSVFNIQLHFRFLCLITAVGFKREHSVAIHFIENDSLIDIS